MAAQVPKPEGLRPAPVAPVRVAFKEGFLAGNLFEPHRLRLAGSRCGECGVALWGVRVRCENCSSKHLSVEAFERSGLVYTFTVQRYVPPRPHALPEAWVPRPLAWVDLDGGGPRVLAPVSCAIEDIRIGMRVELDCQVGHIDQEGREVVTYSFIASGPDA